MGGIEFINRKLIIDRRQDFFDKYKQLNYIDILTRVQIEEAILKYKPTIVFVEHDEAFIKNVATKVIKLKK